jgi:hypothetical protein
MQAVAKRPWTRRQGKLEIYLRRCGPAGATVAWIAEALHWSRRIVLVTAYNHPDKFIIDTDGDERCVRLVDDLLF